MRYIVMVALSALASTVVANNDLIESVATTETSQTSEVVIQMRMANNRMLLVSNIVSLGNGNITDHTAEKQINEDVMLRLWTTNTTTANTDAQNEMRYLSCDNDESSTSSINSSTLFRKAIIDSPHGILLYSLKNDACIYHGHEENVSYSNVYTMTNSDDARQFQMNLMAFPDYSARARYFTNQTSSNTTEANSGSTDTSTTTVNGIFSSNNGSNTAVAMIVLYSITGVITALFIGIIAGGAWRAHRHPERYGPRGGPRSRQSRAKGIARAVLDTLPIVRFSGNNNEERDKVEENNEAQSNDNLEMGSNTRQKPDHDIRAEHATEPESSIQAVESTHTNPVEPKSDIMHPDQVECPICLSDFVAGQDLRVLPCRHSFHPECVDPWLLNVTGSCPLCRINLQPGTETSNIEEATDINGSSPGSPSDSDEALPSAINGSNAIIVPYNRNSSRFSRYLAVIRNTSSGSEERAAMLRQLREDNHHRRLSRASMRSQRRASIASSLAGAEREPSSATEGATIDSPSINAANTRRSWRLFADRRQSNLEPIISPVATPAVEVVTNPLDHGPQVPSVAHHTT